MSIILNGLNMPTERESFTLTIKYNGMVLDTETGMQIAEAHELPPHGRLIDADALEVHDGWMNEDRERNVQQTHITFVYNNDITNAPTIIPREEGE